MTTQEDEINQLISDSLNPSSSEDETNFISKYPNQVQSPPDGWGNDGSDLFIEKSSIVAKDREPRRLARGSKSGTLSTGRNISKSSSTGGLCLASEMSQTPLSPPDFDNEQYKEKLGS
jgi:hypothetical protein